jgi:hypothetical protein
MKTNKKFGVMALLVLVSGIGLSPISNAVTKPTAAQKLELKYLVEEEKLARDVYTYLSENVTTQRFANILKSEQTHMDSLANLMKTYNIYNPTLTRKPGVFQNTKLQTLYKDLIKKGSVDYASALSVGIAIEKLDIADIKKMLKSTMPADMKFVLENLLKGSQNHLAAFRR